MKIQLPLETWTELFGFVPRSQLKKLVPQIGDEEETRKTIEDRQFVSFVQFFLKKFGEVTLGLLHIKSSTNGNGPIVIANEKERELPLADVPIPENVKNFKLIRLSYYDEAAIAFLQEFQRNSLLANVHMGFYKDCQDFLFQIMNNFVPLFTNIESIGIGNPDVLDKLQNEYSELAMPMLASARILVTYYNCRDSWFCEWLHIPRDDGKSRALLLRGHKQGGPSFSLSSFIKHIKKDFLEANQAVSYFILPNFFRDDDSVQSLTLENGKTREKLVIKGANENSIPVVTISRYPIGTNEKKWIEELSQHSNMDNRKIEFYPFPCPV